MNYLDQMKDELGFDACAQECHDISKAHGFWDHARFRFETGYGHQDSPNPSIYAEKIALMHSELSEALESLRDDDRAQEEEELADTIIRILDYSHARGFSMDKAVHQKMVQNTDRPRLHGRSF